MESQLKNHLKTAKQLRKAGKIGQAIEKYDLALELKPNCIKALIGLADIYEEKKELNKAINYRERAVKLMPKNSNAAAKLGKLMLATNQLEKAVKYYQQAIKTGRGGFRENLENKNNNLDIKTSPHQSTIPEGVYHELGDALNRSGKLEEAITAYQTALESNPINPDIIFKKLGDVYFKLSRFEEAITAYSEVIKNISPLSKVNKGGVFTLTTETIKNIPLVIPPNPPLKGESKSNNFLNVGLGWVLINLGKAFQQLEKKEEAEAAYQKAVEIEPENIVAKGKLAHCYLISGNIVQAIKEYKQALTLKGNKPAWIYAQLGEAYQKNGQRDKAETAYQEAIKINPEHPIFFVKLGQLYYQQKRMEEAIEQFLKALEIDPDFVPALNFWATIKEEQEEYEVALSYLQKAIKLQPENGNLQGRIGRIKWLMSDVEAAINEYQKAIAMTQTPGTQTPEYLVYTQLGSLLMEQGRKDEVIDIYEEVCRLYPDKAEAFRSILAQTDGAETINSYQQAIKLQPEQPFWVYGNLEELLVQEGRLDDAVATLNQALQVYPDNSIFYCKLAAVQLKQGDKTGACNSYYKAIELEPEQPFWQVYATLGELLVEQGRLDEAVTLYQQAATFSPEAKTAARHLLYAQNSIASPSNLTEYLSTSTNPKNQQTPHPLHQLENPLPPASTNPKNQQTPHPLHQLQNPLPNPLHQLQNPLPNPLHPLPHPLPHPLHQLQNPLPHPLHQLPHPLPNPLHPLQNPLPNPLHPLQNPLPNPLPASKQAIFIVGMHRSGTSALTRILSLLGFSLPEKLMIGSSDNIKGNWEGAKVTKIHDEVFANVNSSWSDYLSFPQAWFNSPAAHKLSEKILDFLEKEFKETNSFIIKDPRICILLPLWEQPLARFNTNVSYILPLRNPLEVVESLWQRDKIPSSEGLLLWLKYVLDSERHTRGKKRIFTYYDELLMQPLSLINTIKNELDLEIEIKPTLETEINDFLDQRLRHHQIDWEKLKQVSYLSNWVKDAYNALLQIRENESASLEILDNIKKQLDSAELLYGSLAFNHDL